jgi:U4/U6.U5 tri-snRNP component SNU23
VSSPSCLFHLVSSRVVVSLFLFLFLFFQPGSIIGIDKEGHIVRKDMAAYNFYDMVGQRRVVSAENALSEQGFYCEHCDKLCKASMSSLLLFCILTLSSNNLSFGLQDHKSYLEHCNKPKHLAKVGLPSEVRRADVDDVKGRLAAHLKAKKDGGEQQRKIQAMEESRRKALEQLKGKVAGKEAKKKDDSDAEDAKKKQKKDKKQKESALVVDEKLDFDAGAMGLPMGFGSSKK